MTSELWLRKERKPSFEDLPKNLRERLEEDGVTAESWTRLGYVFGTREQARQFVRDAGPVKPPVILRGDDVEVATPSFFDELLKAWPDAELREANADVQASFDLAREHA